MEVGEIGDKADEGITGRALPQPEPLQGGGAARAQEDGLGKASGGGGGGLSPWAGELRACKH